ncbi:MAG: hypothetical protein ACYS76_16360, partial [Planctomycetota bacterium]
MTHRSDEYVKFDYSTALERKPRVLSAGELGLAGPIEARLIGTAAHLVIARLDLTGPITKRAIQELTERLVADGAIAQAVAGQVGAESIMKFFESDLGRIVMDGKNAVWREWPFTFGVPASELS